MLASWQPPGQAQVRRRGGEPSRHPWIFAWTHIRLMLPAWLGSGAALDDAVDRGQSGMLEEMQAAWPFFSTYLEMLEMVLAKTEPEIAYYSEARLVEPDLRPLGEHLRQLLQEARGLNLERAVDRSILTVRY